MRRDPAGSSCCPPLASLGKRRPCAWLSFPVSEKGRVFVFYPAWIDEDRRRRSMAGGLIWSRNWMDMGIVRLTSFQL
ncbi:hypothetical protein BRADI_3g47622v3 [Brachypodium distachyon]|uniref:Uncharacterized protein n=1 Tax=Brachypodium distachyon TaxID=15368 RepID=A0A2K2D3V9_BRADI|nr:hypothetical protein BRADI_3g47622v3 [Brachypodium distachyon]